jgi:hypothetical protein
VIADSIGPSPNCPAIRITNTAENGAELLAPAFCGRAGRGLLRARHLASSASRGLLRAPHCLPGVGHRFDSVLDTYLPAPPAACAALDPWWPCWSRITPCHGLLRGSALRTSHRYSLRRTRHFAFRVAHRLLQVRRFPLCAAHGSLRARRLALHAGLWIAPYSDTLRLCACCGLLRACTQVPHRSQIALCSILGVSSGSRIAPRSFLHVRCCSRIAPRSTLGVSRLPRIAPPSTLTPPRTWIAPGTTLGSLFHLRIAPHFSLSAQCWSRIAPCSTLIAPRWDLLVFLPNPTSEAVLQRTINRFA